MVKKVNAMQTIGTGNLIKKTDYAIKISEIEKEITDHDHDKCITTQEFVKLTADNFAANFATKADIADFVKKIDFDNKLKKKLLQINQSMNLLKMNYINYQKMLKQYKWKD